ncbi:MAG: cysteine desulfurase [Syntrophobacteraceae bacterium]|nr:cysteine desulfurase [Desulfobacteraceae bacterium]
MTVYLDNAATSHPKPASVYAAVAKALAEIGASPGRSAYRSAREASALVAEARSKVAGFFGIADPARVVFTKNATESLNVVLKGYLRPGDRVLISGMEHNAVVRPLHRLASCGVAAERIPCSPRGRLDCAALRAMLDPAPRLVVLNHASNVNGALQPAEEVAALCGRAGVPLLLDAAQTAGVQPISAKDWNLGMLACSGHKGLLGPPGLGILYIRDDLDVLPLMEGGTGNRSEEEEQPELCPERFESGTGNLPAVAGLSAGLDFITRTGLDAIRRHELDLAARLEKGLAKIPGLKLFRPEERGTGTVSFAVEGLNPADVGHLLDEAFDIAVRTGLHCAPLAHETLGTLPEGTVRASVGYATTPDEVEFLVESLRNLLLHRG